MSAEFIRSRFNADNLAKAVDQQNQLRYFTQSVIQPEITQEYIKRWAESKYRTNDYFLNWIKNILRTPNFLSFYKYMRHPLPSAKLINDEIEPMLQRVFHSEDAFFEYTLKGDIYEEMPGLEDDDFQNRLFNAMMFGANNIVIHDLEDVNKPYRFILEIKNVVSIKSKNSNIRKIAYHAKAEVNGVEMEGYAYLDDEVYAFYDKDYTLLLQSTHDLGKCPAVWVSHKPFSYDNDIVRKSMFSYVREELEEYVFMKTLRKMAEVNGAIPVTVRLKGTSVDKSGNDLKRSVPQTPMSANSIGSQSATIGSDNTPSDSPMQVGTEIIVPAQRKEDKTIDMEVVKNFIKFYYIPVECLEFIDKTIDKIERSIIANALGDYNQSNDSAKNADQVFYSFNNKQDKLRALSLALSWTRQKSDWLMMALAFGKENISANVFYGSDFFLDTETELLERLKLTPNPIERKNILIRLNHIRNRFNTSKKERIDLLYAIMPFTTDDEFKLAMESELIDDQTKLLQLQFNYWVTLFESNYGDIYQFFINLDAEYAQKLITIKRLMLNLIQTTNEQRLS